MFGYFARLTAPIDFQAVDGLPVDLVFLLLSPPDAGADHLKALASVSRAFRDRRRVAKLRGARSRDALFALLSASRNARCRLRRSAGGGAAHFRALESLYRHAPINGLFDSTLEIVEQGFARIRFEVDASSLPRRRRGPRHALFQDDGRCRFLCLQQLVTDRFLLTTAFNLIFTRPLQAGTGGRRGPLDQRPAAGVRRRGAADRCRRRGSGARHRHLHALAHPAVQPRRLSAPA